MEIKNIIFSFSVIYVLIISGCADTKSIKSQSSSVTPQNNNAFISGRVTGDNYISMDNKFSIKIPFEKGSREYNLMEIDEFYHEKGASIAFGVANENNNIFNLDLIKIKNNTKFEETAKKLLAQHRNELQRSYHSKPKILKKHEFQIRGHNTIHWNLLQKVNPSSTNGIKYGLVNHQVFAINMDKKLVFIWVQKIVDKSNNHSNLVTAYDFASSVRFTEDGIDLNVLTSLE